MVNNRGTDHPAHVLDWSAPCRLQSLTVTCWGWGGVPHFYLWGWRTDSCLSGLFWGFSQESLLEMTPVLSVYFAVWIRLHFPPIFGWESWMLPFLVGTFCSLGGFFPGFQFLSSRTCCHCIPLLIVVLLACSSPWGGGGCCDFLSSFLFFFAFSGLKCRVI